LTKPQSLALGIGAAAAVCALLGAELGGIAGLAFGYTAAGCAAVAAAYAWNRPEIFGKRAGALPRTRIAALLPFLVAYRLACLGMRASRRWPAWCEVAPGLCVGGRPRARELPANLEFIVDLTAEFSAAHGIRTRRGYRSFPILDGHFPRDEVAFLALLREVVRSGGSVLFHCESGRGRAPTACAAALLVRGDAPDVATAVEWVHKGRPQSHPTRSDLEFLARVARRLADERDAKESST
jgi:protein-tyrosine phosphatase